MNKKMFLTVKEFSRETGVSERTVYKWVKAEAIDYRRGEGKGSKIYIPISEVPTFIRVKSSKKGAVNEQHNK